MKVKRNIITAPHIYLIVSFILLFNFPVFAQNGPKKNVAKKINVVLQSIRQSEKVSSKGIPSSIVVQPLSATKDGYLCFLSAPPSHFFPVTLPVPGNAQATARNFLLEHKTAFGITSKALDFIILRAKTKDNRSHIRFQQRYSGLPVFGAEIIVQLNEVDGVEYVLSDVMRNTQLLDAAVLPITPAISPNQAQQIAVDSIAQEYFDIEFGAEEPNLMIYEPSVVGNSGPTRLVWQTTVVSVIKSLVAERVFIDAHTGEIVLHYSLIKNAKYREVYDAYNTSSNPGTLCRSEGDPASGQIDCDNAYDYLGDTYDFYFNYHGRDSIDDANMTMSATVQYCNQGEPCPWPNAGWSPVLEHIYFGQGFAVDDVTGHEFTHGVTEYESGLEHLNESGAIDESFCDMWGEWVDQTNGKGNDSASVKWLIGEDLPIGAVRDMEHPPTYGDPDRKGDPNWYTGSDDGIFVHTNCGVGNKLCYLLTDGDTFNGHTVTPMGIAKVAEIFYEVQTNLLTSTADYIDLHSALTQAAINLGWTILEKQNLEEACQAIEISFPPIVTGIDPPPDSTITMASVNIDVTFSEPVVGVDALDMVPAGTAASAASVGTPIDLGSNIWRFPLSDLGGGTLNISLAPNPDDIEDITGTDLDPSPTLWSYDVYPLTDLDGDCHMNLNDLSVFAKQWLHSKDFNDVKLTASDGAADDFFGESVSIDGNYAIIGAWGEDDKGSMSGAAYIFKYDGTNWTQQQKLTASDGTARDLFGWSVSIEGNHAIIGARDVDAAYIFEYDGTNWIQQQQKLSAAGGYFGRSVSIDGNYAVIGANRDDGLVGSSGAAYIFKYDGTNWTQQQKLTASDGAAGDEFGWSVSIKGNNVVIGARYDDDGVSSCGSAYIFEYNDVNWTQQDKIIASDGAVNDYFGISVSIDGNYAIIGMYGDGSWVGSAYIFEYDGTNWIQQQKLTASDGATGDYFGLSVSISGNYAVVGAYGDNDNGFESGSAYVFKKVGADWIQQQKLTAFDGAAMDNFASSVSIEGLYAIIGAKQDDSPGNKSGSAYVFELCSIADFDGDCSVNFIDFSILAIDWLQFFEQ